LERIRLKIKTADEQAGFQQEMETREEITNLKILMHKAHFTCTLWTSESIRLHLQWKALD